MLDHSLQKWENAITLVRTLELRSEVLLSGSAVWATGVGGSRCPAGCESDGRCHLCAFCTYDAPVVHPLLHYWTRSLTSLTRALNTRLPYSRQLTFSFPLQFEKLSNYSSLLERSLESCWCMICMSSLYLLGQVSQGTLALLCTVSGSKQDLFRSWALSWSGLFSFVHSEKQNITCRGTA